MENLEREAKEIYLRALEAAPAERGEVVVALGRNRAGVLERVRQLLLAHEQASRAIASGAVAGMAGRDPIAIPAEIGAYRIVREIGKGGMGVVFEAEQSKPKRTVALKVIRPGWASKEMLVRFEYEAELLARLQHPGIAQVFEAGTFDTGSGVQPYFAMELVRGKPLNEYADGHHLGTRDRLALVVAICEALHHAHQKGVIHRDLKPGNILVTDDGRAKILDFGVARLTNSDMQATTVHTEVGQILGTVPYMSPEQLTGDPRELDTRSDVYALGVIAYELLAGRLPHDLTKKMIHEAVRAVHEDEPARLGSINAGLAGDIETIVSKAMEKDKSRRYQSALDLSSDISRYLRDEPITARPASTWYQLRKFGRRNRTLVSTMTLAVLALAVAAGVALGQAARARRGELTAQRNLAKSYSSAAAVAVQRGSWNEALASADLALANGTEDVRGVMLLRIDALAGLDRLDDAYAEAVKLGAVAESDATRASALLWRGDLSMGSIVPAAAGNDGAALVARAITLGLPPAGEVYARALLAENWEGAHTNLTKVVELNPFHVRAQLMLAIVEMLGGEVETALRRAALARTLSPSSAQPVVVSAILAVLADDQPSFESALEGFTALGHGSIVADVRTLASTLHELRERVRVRNLNTDRLMHMAISVMAPSARIVSQLDVRMRSAPVPLYWSKQIEVVQRHLKDTPLVVLATNPKGAYDMLDSFESFGPGLRCCSLLARAHKAQGLGNHSEAIRLCDELMAAPTGLLDLRPIARYVRLGSLSYEQFNSKDVSVRKLFHGAVRSAAFDTDPWPKELLPTLVRYALELEDDELAHVFLSRMESARVPLPELNLVKARVAFGTGDYANAARLAGELLAQGAGKKGKAAEEARKEQQEIFTEATARIGMVGRGMEARPAKK